MQQEKLIACLSVILQSVVAALQQEGLAAGLPGFEPCLNDQIGKFFFQSKVSSKNPQPEVAFC